MSRTRRLAAILAADVVGYSQLIGADESGTLKQLAAIRAEVTAPTIAEPHGRIAKTRATVSSWSSPASSMRCSAQLKYKLQWPSVVLRFLAMSG